LIEDLDSEIVEREVLEGGWEDLPSPGTLKKGERDFQKWAGVSNPSVAARSLQQKSKKKDRTARRFVGGMISCLNNSITFGH